MPARVEKTQGFTFLELVVVLSILAVLTAAILPLYGASVAAMRQRNVRGNIVAQIYFLQELAIRQSRELHLVIDDHNGRYWAEGWVAGMGENARYESLPPRDGGEVHSLPDSLAITRVQARKDRKRGLDLIAFYPNGASDPATIHFDVRKGEKAPFSIETTGALGDVLVTP